MDVNKAAETETSEIKPKMHFKGKVILTSLAGAKVDIGIGKPALIHVSQIETPDNKPIKKVDEVLTPGKEIDVWVKRVRDERIELTMFKPLDLEWRDIKKDMVVKGKVVRLEKFGAFVEIGAERPGLLHVSELSHGFVRTPSDLLKEGDEVEVQIIDMDRKKKQIKLSMKALQPEVIKEEPVVEKTKPRKPGKKGKQSEVPEEAETPAVPEPTVMELAYRQAMDKAKTRGDSGRVKKGKNASREQEEILSRTLENKVQTS